MPRSSGATAASGRISSEATKETTGCIRSDIRMLQSDWISALTGA